MNLKTKIVHMALAWVSLGVFLTLTNPGNLPVVMLIVPFILIFLAFYSLWSTLHCVHVRYLARDELPAGRAYLGTVVCLTAVLLLVLQSLGQLTVRDVITVAAIVTLGYLYLGRSSLKAPSR